MKRRAVEPPAIHESNLKVPASRPGKRDGGGGGRIRRGKSGSCEGLRKGTSSERAMGVDGVRDAPSRAGAVVSLHPSDPYPRESDVFRKCRTLSNNLERSDSGVVDIGNAFSDGCDELVEGDSERLVAALSESTVIMKGAVAGLPRLWHDTADHSRYTRDHLSAGFILVRGPPGGTWLCGQVG